jgi:hypothetical protein
MVQRSVVLVGAALVGLLGCTKTTAVARDVKLDTLPVELTVAAPFPTPIGRYSLCLEFDRPGDSRAAPQMIVALRDGVGKADTLRGAPDRTGESAICWHDSTARPFVGATLTAPRRMLIRHVGWRVPKP